MPESPRWLVFHKKGEKARRVLLRSRTSDKVEEEIEAIEKDYALYRQNTLGEWIFACASHMQVTCNSHASHMQVTCKSHADHMQVTCRSHVLAC